MSLSRVSSMDGMEVGREGTRASMSHRRMSFNPVSDWTPEMNKKDSVVPTYTKEEVSKRKRIGKNICEIFQSIRILKSWYSASRNRCDLLSLRCWGCLWLCRNQARTHRRGGLPRPVHQQRVEGRHIAMLWSRDTVRQITISVVLS